MARKAYPRMSGANPAIRTSKPATDTAMHRRVVRRFGGEPGEGFEVWTECGKETTSEGLKTTTQTTEVTCVACLDHWEARFS